MDFLELAKARFSCRKFTDNPVEPEKLEHIIAAGIAAPTAANQQPVKIWLAQSEDALGKFRQTADFPFVQQAKAIFVVGGLLQPERNREFDGQSFGDVDAAIVATHMMLEIHDLGLGTTWVGRFDAPKLKVLFPEMQDYDLIAMFPVGYPGIGPSERHTISKPKAEIVTIY